MTDRPVGLRGAALVRVVALATVAHAVWFALLLGGAYTLIGMSVRGSFPWPVVGALFGIFLAPAAGIARFFAETRRDRWPSPRARALAAFVVSTGLALLGFFQAIYVFSLFRWGSVSRAMRDMETFGDGRLGTLAWASAHVALPLAIDVHGCVAGWSRRRLLATTIGLPVALLIFDRIAPTAENDEYVTAAVVLAVIACRAILPSLEARFVERDA